MKIKDVNLINNVTGTEKIPVSAGTDAPATVSLDQIKEFVATSDEVMSAIANAVTNTLNEEV